MGRTGIYACGESVSRRNSSESVVLFSLKQEAPASIGGGTFTVNKVVFSTEDENGMITLVEAAKYLGISSITARRRVQDGTIPAEINSKKQGYRVKIEDVFAYEKEHGRFITSRNRIPSNFDVDILYSFFQLSDVRKKLSEAERYMFDRCAMELEAYA